MPLPPGRKLGAYEIGSPLGAGGMGEVYRARDTRLGREVALKVLPSDVTNDPKRLARFDREARAIAALNHPHIVTIFSTEEADGIRFLTMEFVDGYTLHDLVVPKGMAIPQFLEIALPVADALCAAHQKQITHRDLKPSNVMVSNDGRVKVLDFGLASVGSSDDSGQGVPDTVAPITDDGRMIGTMPYMSPEQIEGRRLDPRSDLFSLGVLFYELVSGQRPFRGSSSPGLMSAILRDTPVSLCELRADVPDALDRLVARLLEKRPEDRLQTARDVFNELRIIKGDGSAATPRSGTRSRLSSSSSGSRPSLRSALSVAVLPFVSRSSDEESRVLADGLTDDITSALSRFGYIGVLSRSMVEELTREQRPVRTHARYTLEGHVRRAGPTVRTSLTLVDTQTGTNLWSNTYDRDVAAGTFAIQDEITSAAVAMIGDTGGVLVRAMAASIADKPIEEMGVTELTVRFNTYVDNFRPDEHLRLRDTFERVLELEAPSAEGWACLALLYEHEHAFGFNARPGALERHRHAAQRAVEIDPHCQTAWIAMARTHVFERDLGGLNTAVKHVVAINPLNADLMALAGFYLSLAGEYDRGAALVHAAIARKPQHPGWYRMTLFNHYFARGDYEAALREVKLVNRSQMPLAPLAGAAASGELGLTSEARLYLAALNEIHPALLMPEGARGVWQMWFTDEAFIQAMLGGFNKALALTKAT